MNIYVGNISWGTNERDLTTAFEAFGEVTRVNIIEDRDTGRSKGFGFVEMSNDDDARKAIQELDGSSMDSRNLKVNEARPREERPPRRDNW